MVTDRRLGFAAPVVCSSYLAVVYWLRKKRYEFIEEIASAALENRKCKDKESSKAVSASTWRVHNLLTACELKFEAWIAMSARGLFLTYAIPSISSVLHKTGGFDHDTHRRYVRRTLGGCTHQMIRRQMSSVVQRGHLYICTLEGVESYLYLYMCEIYFVMSPLTRSTYAHST